MPSYAAFARSLVTSTQLLRSWYVLFYQLPLLPELSSTSPVGARVFRKALGRVAADHLRSHPVG